MYRVFMDVHRITDYCNIPAISALAVPPIIIRHLHCFHGLRLNKQLRYNSVKDILFSSMYTNVIADNQYPDNKRIDFYFTNDDTEDNLGDIFSFVRFLDIKILFRKAI